LFYLDNAATTKPLDIVCEKHAEVLSEIYGNPSSLYSLGVSAEKAMDLVREDIAGKLKVDSKTLYFTSSATESNNLAVQGFLNANARNKGHILCSSIEHPSVMDVYKHYELLGWDVEYIPVNSNGVIDLDAFTNLLRQDTLLVSVMAVNNEIGSIQPYDKLKTIIKREGSKAALHVDGVQAFGKIKILPKKLGIDLFTTSSHKIYGPKGVSCLYIADGLKIKPIIFGGGQEKGIRSGTENVPAIAGFGVAVDYMYDNLSDHNNHMSMLKNSIISEILVNVEKITPVVISDDSCLPYTIAISFPGIRSEVLLHHLEREGVFVSSGSACTNNKSGKSYVLKEMGLDNKITDSVIRISPSVQMTNDEIVVAGQIIAKTVNSLIK